MSEPNETKTEVLRVRLTPHYKRKLKAYAEKHSTTESRVIQEYIRRLPDLEKPKLSS